MLASAAVLSGLVGASSARAAAADAETRAGVQVQEVYVTARKREERLIDVPVAITALNSEAVNRYGVRDLKSLTENVPSLMITPIASGSGSSIAIRGLGSLGADVGVSNEVSFVLDGVAVNRGRIVFLGMIDVDQVEVLKGPQALYFGKNSPAGVVSVSSANPGDRFSGMARAAYEFKAHGTELNTAVNIPIADSLAVRIALKTENARGYVRNLAAPLPDPFGYGPAGPFTPRNVTDPGATHKYADGFNRQIGRITLDYKPNDRFSALVKFLSARYHNNSELGSNEVICGLGVTQVTTNNGFGGPDIVDPNADCRLNLKVSEGGLAPVLAARFPLSNGGTTFSGGWNRLTTANLAYKMDNVTLTSVTGLFEMKQGFFGNFGYTSPSFYHGAGREGYRQLSEEIRAQTTFQGPVNFLLGAYFEKSRDRYNVSNYFTPLGPDFRNGKINSLEGVDVTTTKTSSVFGSFDWKLTEELTLSAGARWTHESKNSTLMNSFVNANLKALLGFDVFQPEGVPVVAPLKDNNVSPEVTLTYRLRPDFNLYAAYKTGYKSGGTSNPGALQPNTAATLSFKPEKSKGGEVGAKGEFLDGRLQADAVVYYYKFNNLQVNSLDPTTSPPAFRTTNAAEATTKGVEFQANYRVTDELALRGNLGYNRARYLDFKTAQCTGDQLLGLKPGCVNRVQDFSGTVLPRAPAWMGGAGFTYIREVGGGMLLTLVGDANYKSSYYAADSKQPEMKMDAYWRLDAGVKLGNPDQGWELSLTGKNLTDHLALMAGYDKSGNSARGGLYEGAVTPPRTVTVALTYNW